MKRSIIIFLIAMVVAATLQAGTVPSMMNYQGRLTNQVNLPLDTVISMTFRIYPDEASVSPIWMEQQSGVIVRNGLFTVLLGSTNPILDTVFKSDIRWIGLQVGDDVEMSPRRQFATVAYAFRAAYADSAKFIPVGDSVWSVSNGNAWRLNGKVGVGTNVPDQTLSVNGMIGMLAAPWVAPSTRGLFMYHSGNSGAIYAYNYPAGQGDPLDFSASSLSLNTYVGGSTLSRLYVDNAGRIGLGTMLPLYKLHVEGNAYVSDISTGGVDLGNGSGYTLSKGDELRFQTTYGYAAGPVQITARGNFSNPALLNQNAIALTFARQDGVDYDNGSPFYFDISQFGTSRLRLDKNGRIGIGTTAPGARLDVRGEDIPGALIKSNHATEPACVVINNSTGTGLFVGNTAPIGGAEYPLHVVANNNDPLANGLWVRGKTLIQGRTYHEASVDVQGNVNISGTLTKGGGSFKIDHPLDPENKWLYHSFVESPDMKNIYDGIAEFDANGRAVVKMPEYFQTLNRDFRYQLTCIGGYAQVYIESEVKDNCFVIAGGRESMKVSWQVTGTRQDQWAEQNRIKVEEEKTADERGKVQYGRAVEVSSDERSEL